MSRPVDRSAAPRELFFVVSLDHRLVLHEELAHPQVRVRVGVGQVVDHVRVYNEDLKSLLDVPLGTPVEITTQSSPLFPPRGRKVEGNAGNDGG
jgi:hypothetical protein